MNVTELLCGAREEESQKLFFVFFCFFKDETNAESAAFSSSNQSSVIRNAGLNWCLCFKISPIFFHSWKRFLFFLSCFISVFSVNDKWEWEVAVIEDREKRSFLAPRYLFSVSSQMAVVLSRHFLFIHPSIFSPLLCFHHFHILHPFMWANSGFFSNVWQVDKWDLWVFFSCLEVNTSVTLHCLNFLFFLRFFIFIF